MRLLCVLLILFAGCGHSISPVVPPTEGFEVYLLVGQSNMAGRGQVPEGQIATNKILLFRAGQWLPAEHPLHNDKPSAGVGPGIAFAESIRKHRPKITVGLIPCAVGGTSIDRWQCDGDLFQEAIQQTKNCGYEISGVLWHQGESDCQEAGSDYALKLHNTLACFRKHLGNASLPIVIGDLGEWLDEKDFPQQEVVRKAISKVAAQDLKTSVVSSDGLGHIGDRIHFDSSAAVILGQRYAQAMIELQNPTTQ